MSANAAVDIHALIAAGRVVEAGTLLAMHGEELPPDMRQELEQERQRLWQRASELMSEGEALEQAGWTEEAWTTYQKAAKIACDFPGIQETIKRLEEAVTLTKAVQHRSKRIRQNATRAAGRANGSRRRSPLLLTAVVVLALGAGWWLLKAPPTTIQSPVQTPPVTTAATAPATGETGVTAPSPSSVAEPTAEALPPQTETSEPTTASTAATVPPQPTPTTPVPEATASNATPPTTTPIPPATPPSRPTALTYTVQAGDTLSLIAERQLCSVEAWSKIYKKNRKLISHAHKLTIGTQLDLSGLPNRCQQPQ